MDLLSEIEKVRNGRFLVYVGRFNPVHLGHEAILNAITKASAEKENHLVLVGSCNNPISYRHLFPFEVRMKYLRTVCPMTKFAPLPDFADNAGWFSALDTLIDLAGGNPEQALYIGGSVEDIDFYGLYRRETFIINRYTGVTNTASASEVRDTLIENRYSDLEALVNLKILDDLIADFKTSWSELRKR